MISLGSFVAIIVRVSPTADVDEHRFGPGRLQLLTLFFLPHARFTDVGRLCTGALYAEPAVGASPRPLAAHRALGAWSLDARRVDHSESSESLRLRFSFGS